MNGERKEKGTLESGEKASSLPSSPRSPLPSPPLLSFLCPELVSQFSFFPEQFFGPPWPDHHPVRIGLISASFHKLLTTHPKKALVRPLSSGWV